MKAMTDSTALTATIDESAIAHNVRLLAERAGSPVLAVVKADAYGHGAAAAARAALAAGAVGVGVAHLSEALALRAAGIDAPMTCWLHTPSTDFAAGVAAGIDLAVSSPRQLAAIADAARGVGTTAIVTAKVDTGLGRSGIAPDEWAQTADLMAQLHAEGAIVVRGAMTHLAFADEPEHPMNSAQAAVLDAAVADLRRRSVTPEAVHLANSAAALTRPDLARDLVRPGIAVYGCSPIPGRDFGLIPAMTLAAEVSLIKHITAGQGVSYSHQWSAPRDTVVAIIPAGYADGVPRLLSGGFEVLLNGQRFPSVGRICMDQFVVDLGPDGGRVGSRPVAEGDRAVLFGSDPLAPRAADWAQTIGTIDYEIVTGIGQRAARHYSGRAEQ